MMSTPPVVPLNTQEGGGQNNNFCFTSPNNQDPRTFPDPRSQNDHRDHRVQFHGGPSRQVMHDPRPTRGPPTSCRMYAENSGHAWTSSKMRVVKKLKSTRPSSSTTTPAIRARASNDPSVLQENQRNKRKYTRRSPRNNNNRVCTNCETTTTPLWRSGPLGPKSLCNACGIRLRKERMAEEAKNNLAAPMEPQPTNTIVDNKEKKPAGTNYDQNKRYKVTSEPSAASSTSSSESVAPNPNFNATIVQNNSDIKPMINGLDVKVVRAAMQLIHMSRQRFVKRS